MLRLFCVLNLLLLALAASGQQPGASAEVVNSQTNREVHAAKGVVAQVDPKEKRVTIQHEAISGYMQGMTMPFEVKDTNELTGLEPGDPVSFRLIVAGNYGWIDQIRKTGPKTNVPPLEAPAPAARPVKLLDEGDLLPEYHFTNELGRPISTGQFKGQALAITFLFTRCPFPNFCPLMANHFGETQRKLLSMPDAPTNWHLLTISFDPEFDTPAVLKQYAQAHGADPARWTFATGAPAEVTAMGEQFGLAFWKEAGGIISHNLRTIVIDPFGRVQMVFNGNDWEPEDLTAELVKAAALRR
jgi:protein SCO1/2